MSSLDLFAGECRLDESVWLRLVSVWPADFVETQVISCNPILYILYYNIYVYI